MSTAITAQFMQARIDAILVAITAYETAIATLSTGTVKSYTLDTGQTTQTVTNRDLTRLQSELDSCISRLEYWDNRLNGGPKVFRSYS